MLYAEKVVIGMKGVLRGGVNDHRKQYKLKDCSFFMVSISKMNKAATLVQNRRINGKEYCLYTCTSNKLEAEEKLFLLHSKGITAYLYFITKHKIYAIYIRTNIHNKKK